MDYKIYVDIFSAVLLAVALWFGIRIGNAMKGGVLPWAAINIALGMIIIRRSLAIAMVYDPSISDLLKSVETFFLLGISLMFLLGFFQFFRVISGYTKEAPSTGHLGVRNR